MKKASSLVFKVLKRIAIAVLSLIVIAFALVLYMSPGKTSPILDARGQVMPNSIATIEQRVIGGVAQSLIIRGENKDNPVLLFVHGGPGMSTFPFIKEQFKGMEKLFTICYWDQRGAGKSYAKNIPPESMTLDQLTADGVEVSRYLAQKFHKQKIYILGHSWGTFLASFIIHKHPELYEAYIGIGQVADTYLAEQRSYQFVLTEAQKRNDQKTVTELQQLKIPAPDASSQEWYDYLWIERQKVFNYGGARYGVDRKVSDLVKPMITCREYTISNKINYQTGLTWSMHHLWKYMMINNLALKLPEQQIPVYIFQGIHDHQTDFWIAKDYFDSLHAPLKRFYAFEHSAHSPHVEEYAAFEKIIRTDILGKKE
jgi:pimeloyl-ACP methyl ester carboxylesterase